MIFLYRLDRVTAFFDRRDAQRRRPRPLNVVMIGVPV